MCFRKAELKINHTSPGDTYLAFSNHTTESTFKTCKSLREGKSNHDWMAANERIALYSSGLESFSRRRGWNAGAYI